MANTTRNSCIKTEKSSADKFFIIRGILFWFFKLRFFVIIPLNCRKENEVDPEVTPAKLFRVSRTKPVKGNPYWERQILREFGLFRVSRKDQKTKLHEIGKEKLYV